MLVKKLHDIGMARELLTPLPPPPPGRRSGSGGAGEGRVPWGREGGPVGHCHRGMALTIFRPWTGTGHPRGRRDLHPHEGR